jgi:hypothetical protein
MSFVNHPGYIQGLVLVTVSITLMCAAFARVRAGQTRHRYWLPIAGAFHGLCTLLLLVILWNPSCRKSDRPFVRNRVLTVFDTSQSMSVTDGGQVTRLDRALQVFAETCDPETGPLYQVLGFDEFTYRCSSPDQLQRWGTDTRAQPVHTLLQENLKLESADDATAGPVVGVVLFTDGQWQGRSMPKDHAGVQAEVEFLCIGVGTQAPLPDVGIDSLQVALTVPVNTLYQAQVVVSSYAWQTPVTVELFQDNEMVGTQSIAVTDPSTSRVSHRLSFSLAAASLGQRALLARIRTGDQDLNRANNQYMAVVDVVNQEQRYRALYYAQQAGFSLGKIRQALVRDQKIDLDICFDIVHQAGLAQTAAQVGTAFPLHREQFFAYDLILLGPCDFDGFAPEQKQALYEFVAQRGGGLVILTESGPLAFDSWMSPQASVLLPITDIPVVNDSSAFTQGQVEPSPGAVEAQIFQTGDFATQDLALPLIRSSIRIKPAATVLAWIEQSPALMCQRVGRGRVCLLNMSQLHRLWQADKDDNALFKLLSSVCAHAGRNAPGQTHLELFAQRAHDGQTLGSVGKVALASSGPFSAWRHPAPSTIKPISPASQSLPDENIARSRADGGLFRQSLVFHARVTDEQFRPVERANVLVTLGQHAVPLHPIGQGMYSGQVQNMNQGSFLATVQAERRGRFLGERSVAVNLAPAPTEMTDVQLDESFLRQLTRHYQGQYLNIDEVPTDLGRRFTGQDRRREAPGLVAIWPSWYLFILLCGLLSASWFIRRSLGLL